MAFYNNVNTQGNDSITYDINHFDAKDVRLENLLHGPKKGDEFFIIIEVRQYFYYIWVTN